MSEEKPLFNDVLVETEDINSALLTFSKTNNIPLISIDFDIKNVMTVVENTKEKTSLMFNMMQDTVIPEELLLDENNTLKQTYQILLKPLVLNPLIKLDFGLSSDKFFIKVIAVIKKSSKIAYFDGLFDYLYDEIYKKAARYKMLLYIFERDFKQQLDDIVQQAKNGVISEQELRLTVAIASEFSPSINDNLINHYKIKSEQHSEEEKLDMHNRGFICTVSAGELLIEYVKPKTGKGGRNCRGEFLFVEPPVVKFTPDLRTTQRVSKVEDENSIKFIARSAGFVQIKEGILDISDKLKVTEISFRNTGSIIVEDDKNISLDISEKNPIMDAIASNMVAKATNISVRGSVGDNAQVRAQKVRIDGLTHQSSQIFGKKVEVHIHKGYIEGEEVRIDRLEGGKIVANTVYLGECFNGEVRAKKIYISDLGSNNNFNASELIEIKNISGSDNILAIVPAATPQELREIDRLDYEYTTVSKAYKEQEIRFKQAFGVVEENKDSAMKVKKAIETERKAGRTPHAAFVRKYDHFLKMVDALKVQKAKVHELKEKAGIASHELDLMRYRIFNSKIVCQTAWKNFQLINFKIKAFEQEIRYIPPEGELTRAIGLVKVGEGEYVVEPSAS